VKQAFLLAKQLHNDGKPSFYSKVTNSLKSFCSLSLNKSTDLETFLQNHKIEHILGIIKEKYVSLEA
jgi:hypothetical protein